MPRPDEPLQPAVSAATAYRLAQRLRDEDAMAEAADQLCAAVEMLELKVARGDLLLTRPPRRPPARTLRTYR